MFDSLKNSRVDNGNSRRFRWLNLSLKVGIILAAYIGLYFQIFRRHKFDDLIQSFRMIESRADFFWILTAILLLMLVNWGVEALKWQLLVRKVQPVSFISAFRAVLAGITVSMFTPNRTGEFFGRVLILDYRHRWEGAFVTIIGSMSQLLVTLLIGIPLFYHFVRHYPTFDQTWAVAAFEISLIPLTIIALGLLLLFLNVRIVTVWSEKLLREEWKRMRQYFRVFGQFRRRELLSVLALSLLRYLVFSTQYLIMMRLFDLPVTVGLALMMLPVIFLITTVFPSLTLAELGVRGTVAAFVVQSVLGDVTNLGIQALAASGSLWIINLVLPAVAGTLMIAGTRIFSPGQNTQK